MLRSLLAALVAVLILAAPAAGRAVRRRRLLGLRRPHAAALDRRWDERRRLLPARRRRRRADGQLDAAADLLASPRCRATTARARNDHRARVARRPARQRAGPFVTKPGTGQVARARLGELDDRRAAASTSCSTPRSSTVSSTPTGRARRCSCPAATVTKIRNAIHRTARGSFWRYPTIRLNQVNWYALMYAADATVTGDTTLLKRDMSLQLQRFFAGVRGSAARAGNFGPGMRFHYLPGTVGQRADERRLRRVREHRPDLHALLRPGAARGHAGAARLRRSR